jgi:hypothetical protein
MHDMAGLAHEQLLPVRKSKLRGCASLDFLIPPREMMRCGRARRNDNASSFAGSPAEKFRTDQMRARPVPESIARLITGSVRIVPKAVGVGRLRFKRWWTDRDKARRTLAALDDEELSNLSEVGLRIRREARQKRSG